MLETIEELLKVATEKTEDQALVHATGEGEPKRIHPRNEEANILIRVCRATHNLTIHTVKNTNVLIVGAATLRIIEEDTGEVSCACRGPEDVAVARRQDAGRHLC